MTNKIVESIDEDGVYSDDTVTGLRLRVRRGSKSWILRKQIAGKRIDISLGTAERDIDDVRIEALQFRKMTPGEIVDAIKKRKQPEVDTLKTFEQVASEYRQHCIDCGDFEAGSDYEVKRFYVIKKHAIPVIGKKHLDSITPQDIANILIKIWDKQPTVKGVIFQLGNIFKWAKSRHILTGNNPADMNGDLAFLLPKKTKSESRNHGMLPLDRVADFCALLLELDLMSCYLFLFSILTTTRSKTARIARWEDIDIESGIWRIKASDLKRSENGELTVPLSSYAVRVLKIVGVKSRGLVFPSPMGGGSYHATNFSKLIEHMNNEMPEDERWIDEEQTRNLGYEVPVTQHGIARACFATWSESDELGNDLKYNQKVVHACLHHKLDKKYNGAYNRGNFLLRRREVLEDWGKFCFAVIDRDRALVNNDACVNCP